MSAATQDIVRVAWSQPESAPSMCHSQKQSTTLFAGAVAMLDGTAQAAAPLTAAPPANSRILGVNIIQSIAPPAMSSLTFPPDEPLVFKRGVFGFPGLSTDPPLETDLQGPVYFADDSTVKHTTGGTDLSGTLRAIKDGFFWVEI